MSVNCAMISARLYRVPRRFPLPASRAVRPLMKPYDDSGELIRAGYAVLSGKATEQRDWAAFRTYYAPNARLAPVNVNADGSPKLELFGVDDYITSRTEILARDDFYEIEIARKEWRTGNVVDGDVGLRIPAHARRAGVPARGELGAALL